MIFDTHAHYDDPIYDPDRAQLFRELRANGVGLILNPGCDIPSSRRAVALAEAYDFVYAAVGIHPEDCAGCTAADFSAIRDLCREKKVVAIGEIGLDYYWAENPPKEFQQMVFRRQLELALELELPVLSDLSGAKLQLGPCRYYGTIDRDLVIAAHNYARYFGRLNELHAGDALYLTDVSGRRHSYRVSGVEILGATAIEEMLQSGYELTLFTCTYGGAERITVRCEIAGD